LKLLFENWNIKINYEEKTRAVYFCRRLGVLKTYNVMYLGVTLKRRMTWRHHIEGTVGEALGS
jgi:hypothetical protein